MANAFLAGTPNLNFQNFLGSMDPPGVPPSSAIFSITQIFAVFLMFLGIPESKIFFPPLDSGHAKKC
jgi:hypothetical protein